MLTDRTEDQIVDFTLGLRFADLSPRTVDATRLRIIDAIGVGLAAFDAPAVKGLRNMAPRLAAGHGATLWGSGIRTTADHAALTNGAMIRYLDMNDAYVMTSTAHPSDNLGGLLALAECRGRSFADLILATVISYEIQCRFCDVVPFHQKGWDQAICGTPAAAMAAARLLSLDPTATRNALALAVTPNLPTYQTRWGKLSMWKGLAGPNGARLGVHAAMLAASGITGPEAPFEGPNGLWKLTVGEPYAVPLPSAFEEHIFAVEESDVKLFPIRNACQLPVRLALEMRNSLKDQDISRITVRTDEHAFGVPSKDPALWKPVTRESADHSLPFCVAVALLDGQIGIRTFESRRFLDADVLALIERIRIEFDPRYNERAPATRSCRLIIEDGEGNRHELERSVAPGDKDRQPATATILAKFSQLVGDTLSSEETARIIGGLENVALSDPASAILGYIRDGRKS